MSKRDLPSVRELRLDPAWGDVLGIAPLGSGANHELFKIDFGSHAKALKRPRKSGVNRLRAEGEILRALKGAHAPALVAPVPAEGEGLSHLWMEYIPGDHRMILDEASAASLGRALRHIHLQNHGARFPGLAAPTLGEYVQTRLITQLEASRPKAPASIHAEIEQGVQVMRSLAMALDREGDKSKTHRCLVHTDVIPLNVIFTESQAVLIDWELGRFDYPEWDLASVEKAFRFDAHAHACFEQAYGLPVHSERIRLIALLHYANVVLWRLCSFYVLEENREGAARFLAELDAEIEWIRLRIRS